MLMYNKADLKDKNTRCKHSLLKIRYSWKYCFFLVNTNCKIFRFYSNPIVPWNILFANIFCPFLAAITWKLANMFFKSWGSVQQTWKKLLKPQNLQRKLQDKTKFCKKNKRGAWKMSLLYNWAQSVANTFRLRNHMAWIWRQQRPKSAMFLATLRLLKQV